MSWLERAKKAMEEVAKSVTIEAQVVKLQAEMAQLEAERERQYAEAGRRARELYRAGRVLDDELGVILKRIDDIDAALEELRTKVAKLRSSSSAGEQGAEG